MVHHRSKLSKFITTEAIPNSQKDSHQIVWNITKQAFHQQNCIGYWRYSLFAKVGESRKEPDILIVDRELGLIVIEIEAITVDRIVSIQGDQWQCTEDTIMVANPLIRSNRCLQSILSYCDREDNLFRKVTGYNFICLPYITLEQWQEKGLEIPNNCSGIIFKNHLEEIAFFEQILQAKPKITGESLQDEQWLSLQGVLSGTPVLRRSLRNSITHDKSRSSIVAMLGEWMYETDLQQEHIAKEIPPGMQRIRGIAGSGKTVLLCQKAVNMYLKHPDWDIALVFFSRSLYQQIESLVDRWLRRFSNGEICYNDQVKKKLKILHAWGGNKRAGLYSTICEKNNITPQYFKTELSPTNALAQLCKELLSDNQLQPIFDAILIDEGQDLISDNEHKYLDNGDKKQAIYWMAYESLRPVNPENPVQKRLIWAYDESQSLETVKIPDYKEIFGESLGELLAGKNSGVFHEGGIKKNEIMHYCYRTPAEILTFSHAIGMGLLRPEGMLQGLTRKASWEAIGYQVQEGKFFSGQKIVLHRPPENSPNPVPKLWGKSVLQFETYDSREEELESLAEGIKYNLEKDGLQESQDILVIVLGSRKEAYELENKVGEFLQKKGINIYIASANKINQLNPSFQEKTLEVDRFWYEGGVTISRIYRAKGNEANIVYVIGVDQVAKKEADIPLRNQLFVALTRSKGWATLSGIGNYPFYDEIRQVISSGDTFTFTYKKPPKINTGEETEEE